MSIWQAIWLGLLQGVTEFLPVSSSGHLMVMERLLSVEEPGTFLVVALHFGTLTAIIVFFRRELWRLSHDGVVGLALHARGRGAAVVAERAPQFPAALAVAVGSVPVAVAGAAVKLTMEEALSSLVLSGACLVVTGCVLLASRFAPRPADGAVGPRRGVVIGLAQAVAVLPGISRSGVTIVAGRFMRLPPGAAARFSFLLAVPAMCGAALWEFSEALTDAPAAAGTAAFYAATCAGTLVAMATGLASLRVLMRIVIRGRLHWFAAYCVPLGLTVLALALWMG